MKRILFACIAICFFACSPNREPETVLKLSTTDIVFSANEETQSFNVESNEAWAITQIPEWLNMDSNNGKGNRKVMVTAKANPSEQERSATLKISIKDKSVELKIRQLGKNVTLSLSKTEIMFPAEPGTESISFDITVNEAWTINNIPEWCTFSANKGNESTTVTITAEKNYIDTQRGAIVQVKAGSKTAELTLKQEALNIILQFSNMDLTASYPETIEVSAYSDAAMRQVMIRSNTKWGVNSGVEWVTLDKNSGIENESLTLNIAENRNKTDRSANVTISAGSKSIKIIVRQSRLEDVPSDNPYQINERDNAPHIGDELLKRQVEYVDPGSAGENITWDFSHLQFTNNDYQVTYTEPPFDGTTYIMGNSRFDINQTPPNSLIVCTQYYTMYYFQIKNNQLLEVGHENPATILDYNPKPAEEIYPSYYDTYYKSDYKSTYLYSATVPGATKGYKEIKADGYGTIVLPGGTYANTLRIKYVKTIQNVDVPGGGILLYPEQIQEYTIYKWYVKGYRYPVLETHREINLSDNSEVFSTAFYCPPAEQPNSKLGKTQAVISKPKNVKGTIKLSRKESILPILQLRFSSPPFNASRPQPENN